MAIVKFISENPCHIFIDMEFVGEIQADKMLKVSLETGSYLVETKDINGNYIKKYELKVDSTEAQILQNLSAQNDNLENTIKSLKNDSSLRFYHQRAVFSHNDCFGYINSQYNVIIQPVYSYADDFLQIRHL